jgi:creatinine amidohydrolase
MAAPILLAQRTWPEVRDLLSTNQVVLVPVGACEQHGHGIALATDTISADGLCRRAAALLGDRAAVAPAVPYGVSGHYLAFPGTISLTGPTLAAVLAEVVSSLAGHGFSRVVLVNGHGGNTPAIALAVERSHHLRPGTHALGLYGYGFIAAQARDLLPLDAPGHAGGDEAAVVMAEDPSYARPEAFCPPDFVGPQRELSLAIAPYNGVSTIPYHELTRNGATGDTRPATAAIGNQILDRAGAALAGVLETFIAATAAPPA